MDIIDESTKQTEATETRQISPQSQASNANSEILRRYRQQLAKDPRNVSLLNEVGLAAEEVGDNDRARWAYKRAIRLDPGYEQSYRNLGLLYRKEGREGPAVEALRKYMQWTGEEVALLVTPAEAGEAAEAEAIEPQIGLEELPIYARLDQVWTEMGLTPAEAMMLLDPENSDGLQMMQNTLIDLVARGVLEADPRQRIGRGEAYGQTNLTPHEALFAKYFSRISDYVDVDKLVRAALAELDDDGDAYKAAYVRRSLLQKGYMQSETKRVAGVVPVQQVAPSKKGAQARNRLQRLLKEADRQLARSLANNPDQANAYVEQGGPALLLMDAYPSHHFKRWHQMLTRMGLGPAMRQLRSEARKSNLGAYVDDILSLLLGE
jgi:tetratricopeptide (TPR) repeat protein